MMSRSSLGSVKKFVLDGVDAMVIACCKVESVVMRVFVCVESDKRFKGLISCKYR